MKEQYQKEVSQIHVPKELLEKTKQAMKEEEERLEKQNETKRIPFSRISLAAAAAVLLLIVIPVVSFYVKTDENNSEQKMPIQLSGQKSPGIGQIEKGEDAELKIEEVSERSAEFENAKETLIGEKTVFMIKDIQTGNFKAYFEKDQKKYEINSAISDEEEFKQALEENLN